MTGLPFDSGLSKCPGRRSIAIGRWRYLLYPVCGAAGGVLLALAVLNALPAEYTATMVVGPTSLTGPAAMGARAPIADRDIATSIAEHAPNGEDLSDFARYLHLLGTPSVAAGLLGDPALLQGLFPERWDAGANRWTEPASLTARLWRFLLSLGGRKDWVSPDAHVVARALRQRVIVSSEGTGPMRRISLRDRDPGFALALLRRIAQITETHMRAEARRRTATQIAFIGGRLAGVSNARHREALVSLLAEQERLMLMLDIDLPLAADPIEPPAVASLPDWPNPVAVLAGFAAVGLALGALGAGAVSARQMEAAWRR